MLSRKYILILFVVLSLLFVSSSIAQGSDECIVDLRALLVHKGNGAVVASHEASMPTHIEAGIWTKLKNLGVVSAKVVGKAKEEIVFGKKRSIRLFSDHRVVLRPISVDEKGRILLWLNWRDSRNKILDTRLLLSGDDYMVAGTDGVDGTAYVLAVRARRKSEPSTYSVSSP